eukprot:3002951-Pyramimonas_sp.AAC.1
MGILSRSGQPTRSRRTSAAVLPGDRLTRMSRAGSCHPLGTLKRAYATGAGKPLPAAPACPVKAHANPPPNPSPW